MINIKLAIRNLFRKGQSNIIKIICLATGLAFGLVLIAKVCFIDAYNSNIPGRERIYRISSNYRIGNAKDSQLFGQISGGVAPAMAAEIPDVETATRITTFPNNGGRIVTSEGNILSAQIFCADTDFFDVFDLPIVSGDPKRILAQNGHMMVSRSLAEKLGGVDKAVGMQFFPESYREYRFTVDGIFEDLPENCSLQFDALCSIEAMGARSLNNWLGNDRYIGFVKLRPGADPLALKHQMRQVQETHVPIEQMEQAGVDLWYTLTSLHDMANEDGSARNTRNMMLLLGLVLLIVSVLNYLLLVVSTLITRVREISVNKCFGASNPDILRITFSEALLHMTLSLALAAGMIFLIKDRAETLLTVSMSALFTPRTLLSLGGICLILIAITTIVPAWLFARIPVAAAFRSSTESKRVWKLGLLFVQFAAAAIILGVLMTVTRQYNYLENIDRGYEYENLLVIETPGLPEDDRKRIMDELSRWSEVQMVSACYQLPFGASGNNIYLPGDDRELLNVADMYSVCDNYFDVMGIPIIDGEVFKSGEPNDHKVIVSRRFVERMAELTDWTGSAVGREILVTEHSDNGQDTYTIIGIHEDFRLGNLKDNSERNLRPTVFFYDSPDAFVDPEKVLVRLGKMDGNTVARIGEWLSTELPEKHLEAEPLSLYIAQQLSDERNMRDAMLICSIAALIITLIGLLGYTADEVGRRRREIAIRKVSGATVTNILKLIERDISLLSLPALLFGGAISWLISNHWLTHYPEHVNPSVWLFATMLIAVFALILACLALRSLSAAKENPCEAMKNN